MLHTSKEIMSQNKLLQCPKCSSKNIVKKGIRKNKFQTLQQYQCKNCKYIFTQNKSKNTTYTINTILKAISIYNLGYNLKQTKEKLHLQATIPTISSWLNKYKTICTFHRLRQQATKLYNPSNMIFSQKLQHNQVYNFQLHKAKLELTSKELLPNKFMVVKDYLNKIPTSKFPHHIFQPKQEDLNELARSSQIKFKILNFVKLTKQNQANQLAKLALSLTKNNKQRHESIQNFMITNDSTTVACEVPLYLTNDDIKYFKSKGFILNLENYQTPITGHIDILQVRNGSIYILDYKPEAEKQDPVEQLTIYAMALASRTKLALKDFKCAWFDEKNYFEFFPLHDVYEKQKA